MDSPPLPAPDAGALIVDTISTGGCMCGQVRYAVQGPLRDIICCHCEQCRRSSGHFVAATACRKSNFRLTTHDTLRWYSVKPGLRRGFCAACGTSLTYRSDDRPTEIDVTLGTLDEPTRLAPQMHVWVEDKLTWVRLAAALPQWPRGAGPA